MEIVLIRHGQPNWVTGVNAYTADPKLTDLGRLQSEKSSTVFDKSSVDELWVSPLTRAQETHLPFKDKSISKNLVETNLKNTASNDMPYHVKLDSSKLEGTVLDYCDRNDVSVQLDELLVIEYYSRR